MSPGFFKAFEEEFTVLRWQDFFDAKGRSGPDRKHPLELSGVLKDGHVDRKLEGPRTSPCPAAPWFPSCLLFSDRFIGSS